MPRRRKTASGAPAQPITPPAGGPYGARADAEALARALPAPAGPAPAPAGAAPGAPPRSPTEALAGFAGGVAVGGALTRPSAHPDIPVTAGAQLGPGPGVEALGLAKPQVADLFWTLAAATGDSWFAALAAQAEGYR